MEEGAASHNGNYVREFDPEGEFCVDYGGVNTGETLPRKSLLIKKAIFPYFDSD